MIRHTIDAIFVPVNYGKNTDTHSEYVILIMSQMVTHCLGAFAK